MLDTDVMVAEALDAVAVASVDADEAEYASAEAQRVLDEKLAECFRVRAPVEAVADATHLCEAAIVGRITRHR